MILRASDVTVREATPRELARWDELLDQRAVTLEPRTAGNPRQEDTCVLLGLAPVDVVAPAAEAGLDDERRRELDPVRRRANPGAPRLWDPRLAKQPHGAQLVVRREERGRTVPDLDAAALGEEQIEEAGLDAVERGQHVEAADHDVAARECCELPPGYPARVEPEAAPGLGEPHRRPVGTASEECDSSQSQASLRRKHAAVRSARHR